MRRCFNKTTTGQYRGFTIVELLIVIVVIGVLAAITVVAYSGIQDKATNAQRVAAAKDYQKIITSYIIQYGKYPKVLLNAETWCLGEGYPDWNSDGTQACFMSNNVKLTLPTLNTELKKVASLPNYNKIPVPSGVIQYLGIAYRGISIDGVNGRTSLFYWLKGDAQSCVLSDVMSNNGSNDYSPSANPNTSSGGGMTMCVISLPDPLKI